MNEERVRESIQERMLRRVQEFGEGLAADMIEVLQAEMEEEPKTGRVIVPPMAAFYDERAAIMQAMARHPHDALGRPEVEAAERRLNSWERAREVAQSLLRRVSWSSLGLAASHEVVELRRIFELED